MIDYKSLEVGDLTAASINSNIHKGTIVKGIIYDTSKDSDGGAWRKRCQDKSWYTETLGGTNWLGQVSTAALAWAAPGAVTGSYFQNSTDGLFYQLGASSPTVTQVYRGNVREFPAVVAVIAESARVVIYDLTQSGAPMWRSFVAGATNSWWGSGSAITSMTAMNGAILVGASGFRTLDFIRDRFSLTSTSGSASLPNISAANVNGVYIAGYSGTSIVNSTVNDVAITVLDTAPIDPATGLPVPTIAVATAGGVSVIKDDGTVVNSANTSSGNSVSFSKNYLYFARSAAAWGGNAVPIAGLSGGFAGTAYTDSTIPSTAKTERPISVGDKVAFRDLVGLTLLKENPATPAKGMVAYIANAFNSGWQVGDIRGAYLADTVAETIAASGELVTNGTFTTDTSGWSVPTHGTAVFTAGVMRITNTDATGYARSVQGVTTVVGKRYVVSGSFIAGTSAGSFGCGSNPDGSVSLGGTAVLSTSGSYSFEFTAAGATSYVFPQLQTATNGLYADFDNISVKLAEPDRSVKNTGLVLNGTLTKTAVASGAGLVAYSGMNTSNYLEQPFSTNLDFGTGEFCYMGWVYNAGTDHSIIHRGPLGSITGNGVVDIWTYETAGQIKSAFAGVQLTLSAASNTNHFVAYVRTGGVLYGYVNGVLAGSIANTNSMTLGTSDSLYIGKGYYSTGLAGGIADRLALWRISATAPSADQIAHIYRTELPLFQPNAKCTIDGTSTAVTALAYDDVADELHVGTSWGRSEFKDLLRVASEATTTGSITSLSANEGVILTGGTSAKVYAPAMYLRDELRRKDVARKALGRTPVFFDFTATASQTAFVAPKGYTIKALYKNGTLMRETTSGVYWTRSNDGFQETATLSVGASVSDWVSIMCVRV